jgi:peptidyl-tRNA hydrolase, PTH1 family
MHFYKLTPKDVIVVHDELAIPFGQIRTRVGGSDAGHNGVKSLIQHIEENFNRIRVGVQNEQAQNYDSADFVLAKFNKDESVHVPDLTREIISMLTEFVASGDLPHDTRSFLI